MSQDTVAKDTPGKVLMDPQALNMYAYARNNPVKYVDPNGELFVLTPELSPITGNPSLTQGQFQYSRNSLNQLFKGSYSNSVTGLGTTLQIGSGFLGVDLPADIRDVTYDLQHWQWTTGHIGNTLLDGIGVFPVIGSLKYLDEINALRVAGKTLNQRQIANLIANGHAWEKHASDFPEFKSSEQLGGFIHSIMKNPSESRKLHNGGEAFWDKKTETIVITDPGRKDFGTAYRPDPEIHGFESNYEYFKKGLK